MREVVTRVQDAGFVLKGGGALVFVYGEHRHTTDLDFDAERKSDVTRRIRRAAQAVGVELDESTWWSSEGAKGSRTSIRYRVRFLGLEGQSQRLQVDTRYRPRPESRDIVTAHGIRTYKPEALFDQKLAARRGRNVARDIVDLAFLARRFGDALTDAQISKVESITRDMDSLERKLHKQLRRDKVLASLMTAESTVIGFRMAVERQMRRREMTMPEQGVPISIPMTEEIIALRRMLHGEEHLKEGQSLVIAIRRAFDRHDSDRSSQQLDRLDR